jgi:hypothetical protein
MERAALEDRSEAAGLVDRPRHERGRHHEDVRRRKPLDAAQQLHAAEDDRDVEQPEQRERDPLRVLEVLRRIIRAAEQVRPPRPQRDEEHLQRGPADPRIDPEPAARDERTHDRGQVRTRRAVGRAREHRERDAVLRARVRVEQDRREHDEVTDEDRGECLPPREALLDHRRREHVRRDAVSHRDPQRGVVPCRPRPLRDRDRCKVVVVQGR